MKDLEPNTRKLTTKKRTEEDLLNEKAENELKKIKEIEKMVDRSNLIYRANEYKLSFKNFRTIKTFLSNL